MAATLYLKTLIQKFSGGPVGVDTLAASMSEEAETLEDVIEPYLLQKGYLDRTAKGRMATVLAYDYLGIKKDVYVLLDHQMEF